MSFQDERQIFWVARRLQGVRVDVSQHPKRAGTVGTARRALDLNVANPGSIPASHLVPRPQHCQVWLLSAKAGVTLVGWYSKTKKINLEIEG